MVERGDDCDVVMPSPVVPDVHLIDSEVLRVSGDSRNGEDPLHAEELDALCSAPSEVEAVRDALDACPVKTTPDVPRELHGDLCTGGAVSDVVEWDRVILGSSAFRADEPPVVDVPPADDVVAYRHGSESNEMMAVDVHPALTLMAFRDSHLRTWDELHLMALIIPDRRPADAKGFTSQRIDANLFLHRDSLVNMKFGDFYITRLPVFFSLR